MDKKFTRIDKEKLEQRREVIGQNKAKLEQRTKELKNTAHETKENVKANIKTAPKKNVVVSILKLLILLLLIFGVPLYCFIFQQDFIAEFKNIDDILAFLNRYETESILVYIGLQIMQIIISVLPGQVFQFAAGYFFKFGMGLVYSVIGAALGTTITFYIARALGKDAMHLMFGEERMKKYVDRLNSKRAFTIVFLIYLIPGIPKDLVSYAAGISEMKIKPFIILSTLGRLPGMMGSLLIGSMYYSGKMTGVIIVASFAVVAFMLCVLFRKKLSNYIDKFYEKLM